MTVEGVMTGSEWRKLAQATREAGLSSMSLAFTGLQSLSGMDGVDMDHIRCFDMSGNPIASLLRPECHCLRQVEVLRAQECLLVDVSGLRECTKLQWMDIRRNPISITSIPRLPSLKSLWIDLPPSHPTHPHPHTPSHIATLFPLLEELNGEKVVRRLGGEEGGFGRRHRRSGDGRGVVVQRKSEGGGKGGGGGEGGGGGGEEVWRRVQGMEAVVKRYERALSDGSGVEEVLEGWRKVVVDMSVDMARRERRWKVAWGKRIGNGDTTHLSSPLFDPSLKQQAMEEVRRELGKGVGILMVRMHAFESSISHTLHKLNSRIHTISNTAVHLHSSLHTSSVRSSALLHKAAEAVRRGRRVWKAVIQLEKSRGVGEGSEGVMERRRKEEEEKGGGDGSGREIVKSVLSEAALGGALKAADSASKGWEGVLEVAAGEKGVGGGKKLDLQLRAKVKSAMRGDRDVLVAAARADIAVLRERVEFLEAMLRESVQKLQNEKELRERAERARVRHVGAARSTAATQAARAEALTEDLRLTTAALREEREKRQEMEEKLRRDANTQIQALQDQLDTVMKERDKEKREKVALLRLLREQKK